MLYEVITHALIRYRVFVEIQYFIALCQMGLPQLEAFDEEKIDDLNGIFEHFSLADSEYVKNTERTTNHDVKAVEYFLKDRITSYNVCYTKYYGSTGAKTPEIASAEPGWYAVTITSEHGCTANDSLYVFEVDLSVESEFENPVCFGDSTGKALVFNRMGGVGALSYGLEGWPASTSPQLNNIPAGNFTLLVKDSLV